MSKNGTGGRLDKAEKQLGEIRELLQMTAMQTAENAKQLKVYAKEHNREMKEIRTLFKQMIKRIAV
jgi:hypothetical protein